MLEKHRYTYFLVYGLNKDFFPSIKYFQYKIGIQFNNTPLAAEQNKYASKIVNVYIRYNLDYLPKIQLRNFRLKNCLFQATNSKK